MKKLEDLSEADKYCLGCYEQNPERNYKYIDPAFEIGKKIHESLQPEKWEPEGGVYQIDVRSDVFRDSHNLRQDTGYPSRQEAQRTADLRKPLELLNRRIREENERTGFVADWENEMQSKYYINYSDNKRKYIYVILFSSQILGQEPCNKESTKIICKELNDGVIEL